MLTVIFTVLVMLSGDIFNHSFISYTNLTYTAYFFVGIVVFSEGLATKKIKQIVLGSMLIGIMQHVRYDDPFWIIPMLISVIVFIKSKNYKPLIVSTLIIIGFRVLWSGYKNTLMSEYIPADSPPMTHLLESIISTNVFQRVVDVTTFLYKTLWLKYGILIYIYIFSVLISWRKKSEILYISQLITFLILAILYLGTIAMSYLYAKWNLVGGSHVEHAGDGHYYVARDPDSDADEDDEESEYEHCEALPTLATIVHSMSAALEAAYAMGDSNPYKIKP
jgi:hypothetical protein